MAHTCVSGRHVAALPLLHLPEPALVLLINLLTRCDELQGGSTAVQQQQRGGEQLRTNVFKGNTAVGIAHSSYNASGEL